MAAKEFLYDKILKHPLLSFNGECYYLGIHS